MQANQTLGQWEQSIAEAPHFLNATLSKTSDLATDGHVQNTLSNYIDAYLAHGGKPPMAALQADSSKRGHVRGSSKTVSLASLD